MAASVASAETISGWLRTATTSLWVKAMMWAGVRAGAARPYHEPDSIREAGLVEGRKIGEQRHALQARGADRAQAPGLQVRHEHTGIREEEIRFVADESHRGRAGAFVGDADDVDARREPEALHGQVPAGAGPGYRPSHLAGIRLCVGNDLLDRARRNAARATSMFGTFANLVIGSKSFTGSKGTFVRLTVTVMTATAATSIVQPSGAALATISPAMMPPPPPRLSYVMDCPTRSLNFCAMGRATMSVPPPAANGMTQRIGFVG